MEGREQAGWCDTSGWMCTGSSLSWRCWRTAWSATRAGSASRRRRCGGGPADLRRDDVVAVEATGNSDAIASLLIPIVGRVVVSNPSKTRAIAEAKVKTDKVDARILAQLLAADFLPSVWLPDDRTRALRRQVTRRAHLVRQRTRVKNQVHAILARNLASTPPVTDLFGAG